jgi:eukaryotic-like serine/threonine-protein kinase
MPSIPIGTTFSGPDNEIFKSTDFLGQGAFGEVYRAVGETSGRVVAVKLLPLGALADADSKIALLNEINTAQQIRHPNVVQVLFVNNGTCSSIGPYAVMEFISGGNLANVLRARAQVPLERAIEMMIDISQGAKAINARLIHRDIKPDNVLIEGSKLKIGDFGISKFVDESTRLHSFKGRQHIWYMAPESWANQANTIKIDVYSVGLVFYEILALQHPLLPHVADPTDFLDWEKAHLYQPCPDVRTSRNDVPLSIAQLLSRMVSKRPDDRPYWDEVLNVLSQPSVVSGTTKNPTITAAVEAAVARKEQEKRKELELLAQKTKRETQLDLYRYSYAALLEKLDPIVEQFNQEFQYGQITRREEVGVIFYHIPQCRSIQISVFRPPDSAVKIRNGELIGGGWIGLSQGISANLVLFKHGADDLYGRWSICEIKISGIVHPASLIGQFGITKHTVEPFGFKAEYFYEQMQYVGMAHVFNYFFSDDVTGFFAKLIHESCKIGNPVG